MIPYTLVWLRGLDCDGCTIAALGDRSAGGLERLLAGGDRDAVPAINLVHPLLALETGDAFMRRLRRCAAGEVGPFALLVESAIPEEASTAPGWFAALGEENGEPVSVTEWLERLARAADFVVAIGDCAVWGGPHSIGNNPSASTGVTMRLGAAYRSRLGLPVINLTGCSVPSGLLATVSELVAFATGQGAAPALDEHDRPRAMYEHVWKGALALWEP